MSKLNRFLLSLFIVLQISGYSQTFEIITDKEVYKIDETIVLTYKIDILVDSINLPTLEGFNVISGPNKSTSSSWNTNVAQTNNTWIYRLTSKAPGTITIIAPVIYNKDTTVKTENKTIVVKEEKLTDAEQLEIEYNKFIVGTHPKGTFRYVIKDDFGYIEKRETLFSYKFYRKLTPKELKIIKGIN
jgi:hypothetical protein